MTTSATPPARTNTPDATAPRGLTAISQTQVVMEGAGVPVRRALPSNRVTYDLVDPFLLLDDFRAEQMDPEGFPSHPHRGFEIITYFLKGSGSHSDTMGTEAVVHAGGLQRITAGRGMWHGEGSGGETGPVWGLQLWINLAQAQKQVEPSYQGVEATEIPTRQIGDATVRFLVGEGSPTRLLTPAIYQDVTLPAGGQAELSVPAGFQGFVYLLEGDASFGPQHQQVNTDQIAALGPGGALSVQSGPGGAHFVLAAGQPHRERVRWYGPYVD